MSDSYLDGKVREALLAAKGSRSMAQNLLMTWAMKDERLLRFMAQPFLKAISGAAVAGAIKRGVTVPGLGLPTPKPKPQVSQQELLSLLGRLGQGDEAEAEDRLSPADILGGGAAPKPGAAATPVRRPAAAAAAAPIADQATAMRTLAAVYARKKQRNDGR